MIEKWKAILKRKHKLGALFMDFSKGFDTLDNSLLLERCKIKNDFSSWRQITTDVPQNSIVGCLLFNIFINDIFLFVETSKFCNYADDNALFSFGKNFDEVTGKLPNDFLILDIRFFNNSLVLNSGKCHFMTLGTPNSIPNFKCKNITIKNRVSEKLLGVITEHLNAVCKKANLKLHALNCISRFLFPEQNLLIISAYIKSPFNIAGCFGCSAPGGLCIK